MGLFEEKKTNQIFFYQLKPPPQKKKLADYKKHGKQTHTKPRNYIRLETTSKT